MRLTPLTGYQPLEVLRSSRYSASIVTVPLGTQWPRPVIVALHGERRDRVNDCREWTTITHGDYFVLCPSLIATTGGHPKECTDFECAADELKEALAALRKRFGKYVARQQVMLTGYGSSANLVVPIAHVERAEQRRGFSSIRHGFYSG